MVNLFYIIYIIKNVSIFSTLQYSVLLRRFYLSLNNAPFMVYYSRGKENMFHGNARTYDYYVKTIRYDGSYFDVLINLKDEGNEQYVYDIMHIPLKLHMISV